MAQNNYWLMKTEPKIFSIEDLEKEPKKTACWEGVRNYQARNFLRDQMKKGDGVLFYHSNCKEIGIVGLAEVVKEGYPDDYAFDPKSNYYDPKSTPENPRWFMVDIRWKKTFSQPLTLSYLRGCKQLEGMELLKKGSRLSVQPVRKREWDFLLDV